MSGWVHVGACRIGDLRNFKPTVAESFQGLWARVNHEFKEVRSEVDNKKGALEFNFAQQLKQVEERLDDTDRKLKDASDQVAKFNALAEVIIGCLYELRESLNTNNAQSNLPAVGLNWPAPDEEVAEPDAKKLKKG